LLEIKVLPNTARGTREASTMSRCLSGVFLLLLLVGLHTAMSERGALLGALVKDACYPLENTFVPQGKIILN